MILSFDEWLATGQRTPRNKWTFRQYGDYLEGWHQSMPWSYKEMSLSYYDWAESRWNDYPCAKALRISWKHGMALCAKAWTDGVYQEWKYKPVEDAADLMLITFYGKPKEIEPNKSSCKDIVYIVTFMLIWGIILFLME